MAALPDGDLHLPLPARRDPTSDRVLHLQFLKPMWPFMAAGALTFYLVAKVQDTAVRSPEYASDPRNPYAPQIAKEGAHH
ncbi:hypothetical protein HGRIS_012613 [Hohenbuehelia grisea]|uniref:Uncharacterized protein n=1 Tax=Hohenbuehelia grisea TaxID=104357 RepID=A0ABR3ISX7_9AGAR